MQFEIYSDKRLKCKILHLFDKLHGIEIDVGRKNEFHYNCIYLGFTQYLFASLTNDRYNV